MTEIVGILFYILIPVIIFAIPAVIIFQNRPKKGPGSPMGMGGAPQVNRQQVLLEELERQAKERRKKAGK